VSSLKALGAHALRLLGGSGDPEYHALALKFAVAGIFGTASTAALLAATAVPSYSMVRGDQPGPPPLTLKMMGPRLGQVDRGEAVAAASIAVSLAMVGVKAAAAAVTGSSVVLAEVVDSLGDVLTSTVTLLGLRISKRPPDRDHPYGHGKVDSLLGMVSSIALLEAEAYVLARGFLALLSGAPPPASPPEALAALLGTSAVNAIRSAALWSAGELEESRALRSEALNYAWDAVRTAVIAGILVESSAIPWLDPLSAVLASALLMPSTARMAFWSACDLLDRVDPEVVEKIGRAIESVPGVTSVERIRARKVGKLILADAVVAVDPDLTAQEFCKLIREARRAVEREVGPADVLLSPSHGAEEC